MLPDLPDRVYARVRETPSGQAYYIVRNHTSDAVTAALPAPMRDALTGAEPADTVRLDARGVAVLTESD